jgi:class 3 adenylate cyclase
MTPRETRYAKSGNVSIAYQVVGRGDLDLVFIPGFVSNLDLTWENPDWVHFYSRLAGFSRLILFDKRGTGLSDRIASAPPSGSANGRCPRRYGRGPVRARGRVWGIRSGAMSMLFAATYPERTRALALYGTYAHYLTGVETSETQQAFIEVIERGGWGTGETIRFFMPSKASDENARRGWARWERAGASPAVADALYRMNREIDVRPILPVIRIPTLVLHRMGDPRVNVEAGRYIGNHIPGAKYVELPGADHVPFDITDRLVDEIEEFLTGSRGEVEADRVLATVLFTDIVESTKRAFELGDREWGALLDRHYAAVRQQIGRFRGREVRTMGDGFLATFDGPARAVRCASAISQTVQPLGITVRSGLHTGEIELKEDDIGGIAVNIAARIVAMAGPGETLVSSTVRDLVAGSGLRFEDRGFHLLRGLPEEAHLFSVQGG